MKLPEKGFSPLETLMRQEKSKRPLTGFSLLELMMGVAILLISICSLLFALVFCLLLNESSNNLTTATNDAQYVLEQVKSLAYNDIPSYVPPTFNNLAGESITLNRTVQANITTVTVNVNWQERQNSKNLSLSTYFAE